MPIFTFVNIHLSMAVPVFAAYRGLDLHVCMHPTIVQIYNDLERYAVALVITPRAQPKIAHAQSRVAHERWPQSALRKANLKKPHI